MTKRFWKILDWLVLVVFTAALTIALNVRADNITISNGPGSSNPDYTISTDDVGGGVNVQRMKLVDPTDNSLTGIGVQSHPLWCSLTGDPSWTDEATFSNNNRGVVISIPDPLNGGAYAWTGSYGMPSVSSYVQNYNTNPLYVSSGLAFQNYGTITANGQSLTQVNAFGPTEFRVYGTYSGVTLAFEATIDNTNWFAVTVFRPDNGTFESSSGSLTNTQRFWRLAGNGYSTVRMRATSFGSGTMNVSTIVYGRGSEPVIGAYAAQSGSWTVNVGSITTLPSIPAGNNNIGDVDIASIAAGNNNIGDVDVASLPALPAGNNNIGDVDIASAIPAGNNNIGDFDLASAIPAGNNNIGDVDIASIAAGNNNIGDVDIASIAAGSTLIGDVGLDVRTSGGWSTELSLDVDSTADSIKGSAGKLGMCFFCNTSAAFAYLKSYNLTSVNPASDVPKEIWGIPAASCANVGDPVGAAYSTGIMLRCVTGVANNATGDPGTNACFGTCRYK